MSWGGVAIGAGAIIGGALSSKGAGKQADAAESAAASQVQANRENIAFQKEIFSQQREDNAPWREIGAESLEELRAGVKSGEFDMSNFQFKESPGYQFRLQEGVNALDASAAARGRLQSGAQARSVARYGSNLASEEFANAFNRGRATRGDRFNRLATLANVGQVANQADQSARSNMADSVSQSTRDTGNALAQGAINQGNARASAYQGTAQSINQGMQNYLTYSYLQPNTANAWASDTPGPRGRR